MSAAVGLKVVDGQVVAEPVQSATDWLLSKTPQIAAIRAERLKTCQECNGEGRLFFGYDPDDGYASDSECHACSGTGQA